MSRTNVIAKSTALLGVAFLLSVTPVFADSNDGQGARLRHLENKGDRLDNREEILNLREDQAKDIEGNRGARVQNRVNTGEKLTDNAQDRVENRTGRVEDRRARIKSRVENQENQEDNTSSD